MHVDRPFLLQTMYKSVIIFTLLALVALTQANYGLWGNLGGGWGNRGALLNGGAWGNNAWGNGGWNNGVWGNGWNSGFGQGGLGVYRGY